MGVLVIIIIIIFSTLITKKTEKKRKSQCGNNTFCEVCVRVSCNTTVVGPNDDYTVAYP